MIRYYDERAPTTLQIANCSLPQGRPVSNLQLAICNVYFRGLPVSLPIVTVRKKMSAPMSTNGAAITRSRMSADCQSAIANFKLDQQLAIGNQQLF
jgi:hypothetical protein